jgi:hypothetical protein
VDTDNGRLCADHCLLSSDRSDNSVSTIYRGSHATSVREVAKHADTRNTGISEITTWHEEVLVW